MSIEIKLAAFDMGGVMIRADESIPVTEYSRRSGKPKDEVFAAIFSPERKRPIETGRITPAQHARIAAESLELEISEQEFWRIHCTSHSPNTPVGRIVEATSTHVRVAIASNLPSPHWDWAKATLPYSDLFNPAVLSFEISVMKPDAEYFHTLVRMSGVRPNEIFFTDDNEQNIIAANSLGIRSFLFTGPDQLRADLKECGVNV